VSRADFQISSLKREDVETRCGWETHLNFPGKDAHRVHFNPQGTPRRNMTERQSERASTRRGAGEEKRYGCTYADGGLKAERPVSRARPKREQLIAMCGGRRGILIFPLNAMPRTGVHSGYREGYEKGGEAWSRYTTATGLTRSSFFTSFLRSRRHSDARPETAGVKNISETVFEYIVRSTVLFCVHYLKTFVKRLQTIVWEAALHSCVIVICTSMNLSISLTESNRVFQANDACLQVKLRTQRTGSRSPGAIKCR